MVEAELSFTQSIEDLTEVRFCSDTLILKYTSDRSEAFETTCNYYYKYNLFLFNSLAM